MSVTFTKLFSSITESTVWCEPPATRVVWITMLAMADRVGRVFGSIPGLANRAQVSIAEVETALACFLSPDRYSRTPDNEGRRIEPLEVGGGGGGWRLLNYQKYRDFKDADAGDSREFNARAGKVYFVRCGDSIKIGFSQNPWARLAALKTGMPDEPVLIGYFDGTMQDEKDAQARFDSQRVNREWFGWSGELDAFIRERCGATYDGSIGQGAPRATVATSSDSVATEMELPELPLNYNTEAEAEAEKNKTTRAGRARPPLSPENVPDNLDHAAWKTWLEYRAEIRKPLKPASVPTAMRKLASFGRDQLAVVEQSIAAGWLGLFELKSGPSGRAAPGGAPRNREWL